MSNKRLLYFFTGSAMRVTDCEGTNCVGKPDNRIE